MVLTEEQKRFLDENFRKMKEKDLFEKFSEIGPEADEFAFAEYLSGLASKIESGVFQQNVSEEELTGTSGGKSETEDLVGEPEYEHCTADYYRYIYRGGFPNCAATVEDGSWCWDSDACYGDGVVYKGMTECKKAWR